MGQDGKQNPAPTPVFWAKIAVLCGVMMLSACGAQAQQQEDDDRDPPMGRRALSAAMGDSSSPGEGMNAPTSGTAVGQKVEQLHGELANVEAAVSAESSQLQSLRASTQANATDYFNATAAIESKLQIGTTRGNPILVAQLAQAQTKLDTLSQDVGSFNQLSTQVAQSASQLAFLLESVRATYNLSGAVDEDHVALGLVEDDVNREVVKIDRLLNEISGDLSRQSTYVATERHNLQTLALAVNNGEMYGQSLANRPYMNANLPANAAPSQGGGVPSGTRPLVVIRFTQDNIDYQHAVYQAVSQALDRYPQANFSVMAVSPTGNNAAEGALASTDARRNADGVARTLSQMGIASGRIQLTEATSAGIANTEVRIYVR